MAEKKTETTKPTEETTTQEDVPQENTTPGVASVEVQEPEGIAPYTQVKYDCRPRGYTEVTIGNIIYSITPEDRFIFLGDIPNMKDQCVVIFLRNGTILIGLDKTKFIVVEEETPVK